MIYTINQGLVKDKISKFTMLLIATAFAVVATLSVFASVGAEVNTVTPSTNDANRDKGWAHFNVLDTRVDVLADAQTKNDCKKDGFAAFGFKNQGQCVKFVNTGQDSR